ncbi:MAG: Ig-like domain-containing protein, partial [Pseudomonadota bacterium]
MKTKRTHIAFLASLPFALILSFLGQIVSAQSGPAFTCTSEIYQVQSGQLRIFDPLTSTYQNVGSNQGSYNATGYNVIDNYGYGSQGSNIIRIAADGSTEVAVSGISGSYSGDVDLSNNYWLRTNNNTYRRIDLATGSVTSVTFSGPGGGPADVTYIEFGGNQYLVGFSSSTMFRYNISNGTKENIAITGGLPGGGYGATWTDFNGRIFTFNNNTGEIWEVFDYDTTSPFAVFVAQADPSGNNDGFSCPNAPFPNLPPLAFDDDYVTPVNVDVVDNVITNNDNGIDNDPEGGPVTVNTTPVTAPTNGTVVLLADGTFTYTPATNFIGTDTFVYEISDETGLTAQATVTITIEGTIDYTVTKSQTTLPNLATAAGQILTYEVEIENIGDIPLTDVAAQDTAPDGTIVTLSSPTETGAATNVIGQLDVGETWTYSYDYVVTQDDIDAGAPLVNSVTATTDETGSTERTDTAETPVSQDIDYTLSKTVDVLTLTEPGLLTYEIIVTNTGNVTLTDATLTDTLAQSGNALALTSGPTLTGDIDLDGNLDVGEVWTYAATFDATQDQIDDTGDIVNTADFTTGEAGDSTALATTTIDAQPAIIVQKTADPVVLAAPGTVTYTITVTNDGNVTLTGVNLIDELAQDTTDLSLTTLPSLSGDLDSDLEIDVGEVWTYTATFDATQSQIDDGNDIVNTATVETNELPNTSASATTTITQDPSFTFDKSVDQSALTATGTLRYEIAVVNDGNVTMTGITFTDTITQNGNTLTPNAPGAVLTGDTNNNGELDVGESWLYVITLDVEQAQIDDGNPIINTASFDPDELPEATDAVQTTITQNDALGLTKSVAAGQPTSFSAVGDTIDFTFVVENTGNTTRPGPIVINDLDIDPVNPLVCQTGDLPPLATTTCTFTWTATQDDLDAGSFTNTATAEDADGITSDPQQATVTAVQSPAINLEKELTGTPPNFQSMETLNYSFVITNTGNVTLPAPIDVTDPLVTNVSCGAVPTDGLPPLISGAPLTTANSITCSGSYVISSADVDVGSVVNVATVSAVFDGGTVEDQSDAIFPVAAAPALVLEKATDPAVASFAALGDTITYTYTVTNQQPVDRPGVEIRQPIIIEDDRLAAPLICFAATGGASVPVGGSVTCSADYTVTQEDLDAESVTNTATANSTYTNGDGETATVISPPDSVTVTADITPAMTVVKSVDAGAPDPAEVGDSIPYTIVATNTGEQTLSNVAISDPQLDALTCTPTPAPVTLAPDQVLTCTGSYVVSQDDIDDQTVGDMATAVFTNTATATANDPFGVALDPVSGDADHPLDPAMPELTILKELIPDPSADPAYENVGDVLRFRMTVTNTGNTTLNAIEVTDSLVAGTCEIATLAPGGQDQTCLFDYVVEQSDIDAGEVMNTGTATGLPANPGADPVEDTNELTVPGPLQTPSLEVIKSGTLDLGADNAASVGDIITYAITVTNTGNVTITDTAVVDEVVEPLTYAAADDVDGDGDIDTLAPGDSAVVTATYTLDQDDIDLGSVTNTAEATGSDPNGDDVADTSDSADPNDGADDDDPTVTDIPRTPGMTVEKTASADADVVAGTILTYTYDITNTGNVTLTDIILVDEHVSASGVAFLDFSPGGNVVDTLLPGAMATLTATYTVTQDDIDAGADLTNTVTATASGPDGTTGPTATDDEVVDLEDRDPMITIEKSVSEDTDVTVGTVLTYTYEVENTGNVTLENVTIDDQHTSAAGTSALAITPNGGVIATLVPDEIVTLTATYTVTQADIDAGADLTNVVTVTTQSPDGTVPPMATDDAVVDLEDSVASLEAIKTVLSQTGSAEGDQIVFQIAVANTGNVTLDAVTLTDTLRRVDGTLITPVPALVWDSVDDGDAGVLDVGEDWIYTLTYTLTQDDIDAGGITNSVLVEADSPDDTAVSDVSDNGEGDGNDPTPVLIPADPSLEAVKVITSTTTELGGTVRFEIAVTNTGNVTLSDVAIVSDDLTRNDAASTPLTLTGPAFTGADDGSGEGTLQVGETATYSASYVLTQDDIDAGGITNTATVTGTPPIGLPVTDVSDDDGAGDDPTVLDIAPVPSILLDKRLAAGSDLSFDADEEVLSFEFEITNTGNITLSPPYDIADPLITDQGGTIDCPTDDIAPDASIICTADYETTQDDVDNGGFTNVATATVGDAAPATDDVTVPAIQTPALALVKEAPSIESVDFVSGLVVTYTFTSTNTGNTTLTDPITIEDALFDAGDYVCPVWPVAGLAPGETYICTASKSASSMVIGSVNVVLPVLVDV